MWREILGIFAGITQRRKMSSLDRKDEVDRDGG
jgi:hypothetical protein